MYRCPHCGEEAFSLRVKLGITSKLGQAPLCPNCNKVSFRCFLVGGHWLYKAIIGLSAFLAFALVLLFFKINVIASAFLALLFTILFYLVFNYYFCHFDGFTKAYFNSEKILVELKDVKRIWPRIRKGEIYELLPSTSPDCFDIKKHFVVMVEKINSGKMELRIIKAYTSNASVPRDELLLLNGIQCEVVN